MKKYFFTFTVMFFCFNFLVVFAQNETLELQIKNIDTQLNQIDSTKTLTPEAKKQIDDLIKKREQLVVQQQNISRQSEIDHLKIQIKELNKVADTIKKDQSSRGLSQYERSQNESNLRQLDKLLPQLNQELKSLELQQSRQINSNITENPFVRKGYTEPRTDRRGSIIEKPAKNLGIKARIPTNIDKLPSIQERFGAKPTGGGKVMTVIGFLPDIYTRIVEKYYNVREDTIRQTLRLEKELSRDKEELAALDPNDPDFNRKRNWIELRIKNEEQRLKQSQIGAEKAANNVDQIESAENFWKRLNPFK